MIALCRRIVDSPCFQNGILAVIINDLERVKDEEQAEAEAETGEVAARLAAIRVQLEEIEAVPRRERAQ